MKLLALYGFLFVFLLCLNAFTAEGRNTLMESFYPYGTREYETVRLLELEQMRSSLQNSETGQKVKKGCCSKLPKLNKKAHKGINFKMTATEIRKYCKPCPRPAHLMVPGPLPQLK